ncbi:hypothetical protein MTP99_016592 [Tenebrio molitor]|nr:hypothetical protein MTP99_016592 [Tenebrio molitor]
MSYLTPIVELGCYKYVGSLVRPHDIDRVGREPTAAIRVSRHRGLAGVVTHVQHVRPGGNRTAPSAAPGLRPPFNTDTYTNTIIY